MSAQDAIIEILADLLDRPELADAWERLGIDAGEAIAETWRGLVAVEIDKAVQAVTAGVARKTLLEAEQALRSAAVRGRAHPPTNNVDAFATEGVARGLDVAADLVAAAAI